MRSDSARVGAGRPTVRRRWGLDDLLRPAPTTILLVHSLAEYHALLRDRGRDLRNPAFYDPVKDEILCACDLERLGEQLEKVRQKHQDLLARH